MASSNNYLERITKFLKPTGRMSRRDLLKAVSTVPVLGLFTYSNYSHTRSRSSQLEKNIIQQNIDTLDKFKVQSVGSASALNVGIVGFGARGEALCRGLGFAHPEWVDQQKTHYPDNWKTFYEQDDLNVNLVGVCDLFEEREARGIAAATTGKGSHGETSAGPQVRRYSNYREMLDDDGIDAIIIATPDFWHHQMAVDAIDANKHVYSEKCMTHTLEQAIDLRDRLENSEIVYQLGHQNRQQISFHVAKDIVRENLLGDISLVEVSTNRNSARGAWVLPIPDGASEANVDWDEFQRILTNKRLFSAEEYFRWRCWYEYSTGISGDLLSHEFDTLNQIMNLGIPRHVTASGGVFHYKDGRDTPDTFQVTLEYPDRELVVSYSATLANGRDRGKLIMGSDATMKVGASVEVYPESESKYSDGDGGTGTAAPYYQFGQGGRVDAFTGATDKYFSSRGLIYSHIGGRKYDVTHLHLRDWINCIRTGQKPKCNFDVAFEEAVTCHMATASYLEQRKVSWDDVQRKVT